MRGSMSKAAEVRWVHFRWPKLSYAELARLLQVQHNHARSAVQYGVSETLLRPSCLPPEVQEGASLEIVRRAAANRAPCGGDARVRWTAQLADAAEAAGMSFPEYVELAMRAIKDCAPADVRALRKHYNERTEQ